MNIRQFIGHFPKKQNELSHYLKGPQFIAKTIQQLKNTNINLNHYDDIVRYLKTTYQYSEEKDQQIKKKFDEKVFEVLFAISICARFINKLETALDVQDTLKGWEKHTQEVRDLIEEFIKFNPQFIYEGEDKTKESNLAILQSAWITLLLITKKDLQEKYESIKTFWSPLCSDYSQYLDLIDAFYINENFQYLKFFYEAMRKIIRSDLSKNKFAESTKKGKEKENNTDDENKKLDSEANENHSDFSAEELTRTQIQIDGLNLWFANHLYNENFFIYLNRITLLKQTLTKEAILSYYVEKRFDVKLYKDQWDLYILRTLRNELIGGYKRSEKKQDYLELLSIIDQLEDKKYKTTKSKFFEKKPLWEIKINPSTFMDSMSSRRNIQALNEILKSSTSIEMSGPSDDVLKDVVRLNGHLNSNKKFKTDLYIGGRQVIFDMKNMEVERPNEILKVSEKKELYNQWCDYVRSIADPILKKVVDEGTCQYYLTHIPTTLVREQLKNSLLSSNPDLKIGDPCQNYVKIKILDNKSIVYEMLYTKKDKKGNLIYQLSSDVIVGKTENAENPVQIKLVNMVFKVYSDQVKYIFPTFYNQNYLEKKMTNLEIQLKGLNSTKTINNELLLRIKSALRYVGEIAATKLSSYQFEEFILKAHQNILAKINDPTFNAMPFDGIVEEMNRNLNQCIRDIIETNYSPSKDKNIKLLAYYLKDIKDWNKKTALIDVAKTCLESVPFDQFNDFLARTVGELREIPDSYNESFSIAQRYVHQMNSHQSFVLALYTDFLGNTIKIADDKKKLLDEEINNYMLQLMNSDNENISRDDLVNNIVPYLIIKAIIKNRFETKENKFLFTEEGVTNAEELRKKYNNRCTAKHLKNDIKKFINKKDEAVNNLAELLANDISRSKSICNCFDLSNFKQNLEAVADSVFEQFIPEALPGDTNNMITDILLTQMITLQLQHDMSGYVRFNKKDQAYFETLRVLKDEGVIEIEAMKNELRKKLKSREIPNVQLIRDSAWEILKDYDDLFLTNIIKETLHLQHDENPQQEKEIEMYKKHIQAIGKELLPHPDSWMGNKEYIKQSVEIIKKEMNKEGNSEQKIKETAQVYILTKQLKEDLDVYRKCKNKAEKPMFLYNWPDLYFSVTMPALKDKPTLVEKLAELMVKKYNSDPSRGEKIREIATSILTRCVSNKYFQGIYSTYQQNNRNTFLKNRGFKFKTMQEERKQNKHSGPLFLKTESSTSTFVPNALQINTMSAIAAVHQLHYERCQLFADHVEVIKDAKKRCNDSTCQGVRKFFSSLEVKSPEKAWDAYLLKYQNEARQLIDTYSTPEEEENAGSKENVHLGLKIMKIVNINQYAHPESSFNRNATPLAEKVLNQAWIKSFNFDNDWNNNVKKNINGILQGSAEPECELAKLETLLKTGKADRDKASKWFQVFKKWSLTNKLNALEKFIAEVKMNYICHDSKLNYPSSGDKIIKRSYQNENRESYKKGKGKEIAKDTQECPINGQGESRKGTFYAKIENGETLFAYKYLSKEKRKALATERLENRMNNIKI